MVPTRRARGGVVTAILLLTAAPAPAQQDTALASMVAAELAFAAQAEREGIRPAFLAWLGDSATIFMPDPVNGRVFYTQAPATPARLSWYPSIADISSTGDLGYTSGPFEYRAASPDTGVAHGQFASVWRRGADGVWKVELDLGSMHGRPRGRVAPFDGMHRSASRPRYVAVAPLTPAGVADVRASLLALDTAFAHTAAARGTAEAMDQFADERILLQRPGAYPLTGRRRAVAAVAREPGRPAWDPRGGGAAVSGELGYTWGAVRWDAAGDTAAPGYYLRIWRREQVGWRIVLDLVGR